MDLQLKYATPFALRGDQGAFEAVISTDALDRDGEIVSRKALEAVEISTPLPLLVEHAGDQIAGTVVKTHYIDGELVAGGRIFSEKELHRAKAGDYQLSIGFRGRATETEGVKTFNEIELAEVSLVRKPANTDTRFTNIKRDKSMDVDTTNLATKSDVQNLADKVKTLNVQIKDLDVSPLGSGAPKQIKWDGGCEINTDDLLMKAYEANEGIAGSPTAAVSPWYRRYNLNPFLAMYGAPDMITGDAFVIPQLTGIGFTNRASEGTAKTKKGGVSESTASIKNFDTDELVFSLASDDDIPRLRQTVIEGVRMALQATIASEFFSVIKASIADTDTGTAGSVTTGAANALPTAANIVSRMSAVRKLVKPEYREDGGGFIVHSGVEELLHQATSGNNGEWAMRPMSESGMALYGHGFRVTDALDDGVGGSSDGEVAAIFGNMRAGCCYGVAKSLEITESLHANLGSITFYARTRFAVAMRDAVALAGLVNGA